MARRWRSCLKFMKVNMREEIMSWINCLPDGWVSAFGEELCNALLNALGEYKDDFVIAQVKEKYGEMRMYWHWRDRAYSFEDEHTLWILDNLISMIINCYKTISSKTCVICGAPATMRTINGWDEPLCDNCCN